MYIKTIFAALAAWFAGLLMDANIGSGEILGFTDFRSLFPVLVIGLCILNEIKKINSSKEE